MQTMKVLVRVSGSREMTVQRFDVTPAEALLLAHIHDSATKDAFEEASATADVKRSKLDERARLQTQYPKHLELIEKLFPGRTAADIPVAFDELEDVPLSLSVEGRRARLAEETQAEVADAKPEDADTFAGKPRLSAERVRDALR